MPLPYDPSALINRAQQDQDKANEANETRYNQALALLGSQGIQSKADARRGGDEEKATNMQALISGGLGSTSLLQALNNRTNERVSRESSRIDESVALNQAGVIERRSDEGPDLGILGELLRQLGYGEGLESASRERSYSVIGGAPGGKASGGSSSSGDGGSATSGSGQTSAQGVQTTTNANAAQSNPCVASFFNPGGAFGADQWIRCGVSENGTPTWKRTTNYAGG